MKYYLISCSKDWADEFNTYSYQVYNEDELKQFTDLLEKDDNRDIQFVMGIGTNQGWGEYDHETVGDVWNDDFTIKEIPEEHYNVLQQYTFNGSAPTIPDLVEIIECD